MCTCHYFSLLREVDLWKPLVFKNSNPNDKFSLNPHRYFIFKLYSIESVVAKSKTVNHLRIMFLTICISIASILCGNISCDKILANNCPRRHAIFNTMFFYYKIDGCLENHFCAKPVFIPVYY